MKKLFLLLTFFYVSLMQAAAPPFVPGYMAVQIKNNTGKSDHHVYVVVKGKNATNDQCFLQFTDGFGTAVQATETTFSPNYAYLLATFPGDSNDRYFYVPQPFSSSRIYFSIDYPLYMAVVRDASPPFNQTIVDPSSFSMNDPNYYTFYDKVEFTLDPPVAPPPVDLFINPTAVDFFCLPIRIEVKHPLTGEPSTASGYNISRAKVIAKISAIFSKNDKTSGKVWNKLKLPFYSDPYAQNPNLVNYLRIEAPVHASAPGASVANPNQVFPNDYLSSRISYGFNYINNVWRFYKRPGKVLKIDVSEIAPYFGPLPANQSKYYLTGVVNASDQFVFTNDSGYVWKMEKPTGANPFFAGAGFVDDGEANGTPGAVIVRQITCAFEVGFLPVSFPTKVAGVSYEFLNGHYFSARKALGEYYSINPKWRNGGTENGPFYDLYSKAFHSFKNQPCYTFAYDDALAQDGTLVGNISTNQDFVELKLEAIKGEVPAPFEDNNKYKVTFAFAGNNPVGYRQGTVGAFNYPDNGATVTGIESNNANKFQIQLKNNLGIPVILDVYLKYNIVQPTGPEGFGTAISVLINHATATDVTLVTPGLP